MNSKREITILNQNKEKLSATIHENKKTRKTVIICHGTSGSKDSELQSRIADTLSEDYTTIRFSFSGSGNSQGDLIKATYTKEIKDLFAVISYLKKNRYSPETIIGFSKSGSEILLSSEKLTKEKISRIIALAPRSNLLNSSEYKAYQENKKIIEKEGFFLMPRKSKKHKISWSYIKEIEKYAAVKEYYKPTLTTHIIHGTKDKVVNVVESIKFREKHPSVKLHYIKDADHKFTNHTTKLIETIKEILIN